MIKIYTTPQKLNRTELREFAKEQVRELWNTTLRYTPLGKPYLESEETHISISHSDVYWAICAATEPCGIDIELLSRGTEHLSSRFMGEGEFDVCNIILPQNPTLLVWCIKEALFKKFSVEGVDFKRDFRVLDSTSSNNIKCRAFEQECSVEWSIVGELLVVRTI